MKKVCILMFYILLCSSCIKPVSESITESKSMLYKKNIVGISGMASDVPYVEIQHCIDNGMGENIIEKMLVSPPFWFGGQFVNIEYDSITIYMGDAPINYKLILKHDYSNAGAEYLQVINHSEDNSIEFFIAGAQDMKVDNGKWCSGLSAIEYLPSIYYKRAPIYYLLNPDQKYSKNVAKSSSECSDIFYFEGNECGDLLLEKAWDVNDIAKLYRAEYNNSKDTILYVDIQSEIFYGRMYDAVHSISWINDRLKRKTFYGTIQPKRRLSGDAQLWLIATDLIFEDYFKFGS